MEGIWRAKAVLSRKMMADHSFGEMVCVIRHLRSTTKHFSCKIKTSQSFNHKHSQFISMNQSIDVFCYHILIIAFPSFLYLESGSLDVFYRHYLNIYFYRHQHFVLLISFGITFQWFSYFLIWELFVQSFSQSPPNLALYSCSQYSQTMHQNYKVKETKQIQFSNFRSPRGGSYVLRCSKFRCPRGNFAHHFYKRHFSSKLFRDEINRG